MTKTSNYQLPQWEAHDALKRSDFNEAMESIDTAVKQVSDAAATALRTAQVRECVIGSYTGEGIKMADGGQNIELGFRPAFLIISRGWPTVSMPASTMMAGEHLIDGVSDILTLTDTGFRVGLHSGGTSTYPKLNAAETAYSFVAFR